MFDYYKRISIVYILLLFIFSKNAFAQELLTPCAPTLSEPFFEEILPKDKTKLMSIYYEGDSSFCSLYYDTLAYELVTATYDFKNNSTKEYRYEILRRPFNKATPASVLADLIASSVYSSSYCADEIYGIIQGDVLIVTYNGQSAFSYVRDGNCKLLKDIIFELINYIKTEDRIGMEELIPKMELLTKIFHGYYPIQAQYDGVHKRIPALR